MQRLRELMAHGGIAPLAVVFALAFAAYQTANALAQIAVAVVNQHAGDEDFNFIELEIFGTQFTLDSLLQSLLALVLVALALFAVWRLARSSVRTCPECRSDVPRQAIVCRYCTTDLTDMS